MSATYATAGRSARGSSAGDTSSGLRACADELRALTDASGVVLAAASGGDVRFGCSGATLPAAAPAAAAPPAPAAAPAPAPAPIPALAPVPVPVPVDLDTAYDMASITKVLATTASLMRLVSERLVGLDDPVRAHLGQFDGGGKEHVSIRDLLLHRGGLQPWWPLYFVARDRDGALAAAAALPLAERPRSRRVYSDLGFMLLGGVVESVAGASLDASARELVFAPLGLEQTGYREARSAAGAAAAAATRRPEVATREAAPEVSPDAATPTAASAFGDRAERTMVQTGAPYPVPFSVDDFDRWRTHLLVGEVNDGNAFHAFGGVAGHAGLFSTAGDLLRFAGALASIEQYEHLFAPGVVHEFFAPGPDAGQSLGFRRYALDLPGLPESAAALGHPGYTGAAFGFVPGTGCAFVVATNRLLAAGEPVANDAIWAHATSAWAAELGATLPRKKREL